MCFLFCSFFVDHIVNEFLCWELMALCRKFAMFIQCILNQNVYTHKKNETISSLRDALLHCEPIVIYKL